MFKLNLDPSDQYTRRLVAMLSEAVQAKIDEVKAAIAAEAAQVNQKIDELKAMIAQGMSQDELLAALDGLKVDVEGIYSPEVE
jgi:endonuclease III-like uncharacterized protein